MIRKQESEKPTETKPYYWLAINGSSCAACPIPMPNPSSRPRPQGYLGFLSQEKQLEAQQFFLTAPIESVERQIEQWVRQGARKIVLAERAQRIARGDQTLWTMGGPIEPTRRTQARSQQNKKRTTLSKKERKKRKKKKRLGN